MARGPLPKEPSKRRRRNSPTIPSTNLPVGGRKGRAPGVPKAYKLGKAGRAWWAWAWKLPQATAWDSGALYVIARRAQLEDDLLTLDDAETFDLGELFAAEEDRDAVQRLEQILRKLKGLAGGRVSVMREMRELDNRLGLTPKGLAELRWKIVKDEDKPASKPVSKGNPRLRAVESVAV